MTCMHVSMVYNIFYVCESLRFPIFCTASVQVSKFKFLCCPILANIFTILLVNDIYYNWDSFEVGGSWICVRYKDTNLSVAGTFS